MNRNTTLGVLLAIAAAAPAVVVPRLVPVAQAQEGTLTTPGNPPAGSDRAEYPDVPRGHWAYQAIDRLSRAGVIEGLPNGTYAGNKPMTRYEFAVAIARILDKMNGNAGTGIGPAGPPGIQGPPGSPGPAGPAGPQGAVAPTENFMTRDQVNDLIGALRREFADELARLGVRVDALESRVSNLENRVPAPPRLTMTPSFLHRTGTASYISDSAVAAPLKGLPGATGIPAGRGILNGNNATTGPGNVLPTPPFYYFYPNASKRIALANAKYSYTDLELRMTDRLTDRLSVAGALRSLSGTAEDPWAGEAGTSPVYVREAYGVADLSDRSPLGVKGLTLIAGRQRTKVGQGLLYDNDLQPTDQLHGMLNIGPLQLNGFVGTTNNQYTTSGGAGPYTGEGAVANFGFSPFGGFPSGRAANPDLFYPGRSSAIGSGAAVGFPGAAGTYADDNESLLRGSVNLFRIAGQPVALGIARQFDGVQNQQADEADLTIPLFNRTVGIDYVRERRYFNGVKTTGNPKAYNITVPLFRARLLDLNFAYGKADNDFEYQVSSAANPYARTYAEALFDRPLALGAPMINGRLANYPGHPSALQGTPLYAAAKEAVDFTGTLRIVKWLPLDLRYYKARGSELRPGGRKNALDLGSVYTIGSTFNLTPGLDLELKYGNYNVPGRYPTIHYFRVGANVGF